MPDSSDSMDGGASAERTESERTNPASQAIDRMSALEIAQVMNVEDAKVASAVGLELPRIAEAIERIAGCLRRGGRLVYAGAGTSGRLAALDAVECPPTFSVPDEMIIARIAGGTFAWTSAVEDAEDRADLGEADLRELDIGGNDAVVGIAASGKTPYVLGAIAYAKSRGALTVGIACNAGTPLHDAVDVMIAPVVGPEVIAGSTRLKAGTAQKMVLNMLSTGVMVLLGKTYGNLMVDVRPSNAKLRRRALDIVREAADVGEDRAEALLLACDGEVKTAIVVGRTGLVPDAARARLARHDNVLRAALETDR